MGVEERLRLLLACTDLAAADTARGMLGIAVVAADPRVLEAVEHHQRLEGEIETFIRTRVTSAKTEAVNTAIKQIKRTGRGYRNHDNGQGPYPPAQGPANTPTLT